MKAGPEDVGRLKDESVTRHRYGAFILLFSILLFILFAKLFPIYPPADVLPSDAETSIEGLSSAERFVMTGYIDINRADIEGLTLLPGVGRLLAERIIRRRIELGGFTRVDELRSVEGIGSKKLAAIKAFLHSENSN